jgi:hypothetical protein
LNLQIIFNPAHTAHFHGEALGARFLFGRLDYAIQCDHSISRVDIDSSQIRRFLRHKLGFYGSRDRRIIDVLSCGFTGHGRTASGA